MYPGFDVEVNCAMANNARYNKNMYEVICCTFFVVFGTEIFRIIKMKTKKIKRKIYKNSLMLLSVKHARKLHKLDF